MSLNITIPEVKVIKPKISVFGVGGAGGNALNNMISSNLEGVEFIAANTDAQSLQNSLASNKIQLGLNVTKGLGAGSVPDCGKSAAEENIDEINHYLEGNNMVFITAGMGGGTGTGAAPVIAKAAKAKDILTVGVITKPFDFEGKYRMESAIKGVEELRKYVDTLIVIPNQNLFRVATENTTFESAFKMADNVLHAGVRGVTDLITMPGLVNLDFADIKTIMTKMGKAMMGTGEAEGEDRAIIACQEAISNPLLDDVSIKGARGVLVNMTGGTDMTLFEADQAVNEIRKQVDENANIIFGSAFNENMSGKIRVSVVATGIDADEYQEEIKNTKTDEIERQEEDILTFFDPSDIQSDELNISKINPDNFKPDLENIADENGKLIDIEISKTAIQDNVAADNDNIQDNNAQDDNLTDKDEEDQGAAASNFNFDSKLIDDSDKNEQSTTKNDVDNDISSKKNSDLDKDNQENQSGAGGFSLFRFITGKKQSKAAAKQEEYVQNLSESDKNNNDDSSSKSSKQQVLDFTFHDNIMEELPQDEDIDNKSSEDNSDDVLDIPTFFRKKNNV